MLKKFSIILVTYNNLDKYTRKCFYSLLETLKKYDQFEVIFVDNNSTDGTKQWLEGLVSKFDFVRVILNNQNKGFAYANNQAIKISIGEYVILLNNDTIVSEGWIDGLLNKFTDSKIGIVSPITNSITSLQEVCIPGINDENWVSKSELYTRNFHNQVLEVNKVCFFCVAIARYVINDIGLLDENFGLGNFEDDDYCFRTNKKYKILIAEDTFVWHYGSGSFSLLETNKLSELYSRNKAYLCAKHEKLFLRYEQLNEVISFLAQVSHWKYTSYDCVAFRMKYLKLVDALITDETNYLLALQSMSLRKVVRYLDQRFLGSSLHRLYKWIKK